MKSIVAWIILLVACFALRALAQPEPDFVPGRVLVKPKAGVSAKQLRSLFSEYGAVHQGAISQIGTHVLKVPTGAENRIAQALSHNPAIDFAEPDFIATTSIVPDDTYYGFAWHLPKIQAPAAWDITTGTSTIVIAIIDSGIDFTHPDLQGKILPGYDFGSNDSDPSDTVGHGTSVSGAAAALSNNSVGVTGIAWNNSILPVKVSPDGSGSASYSAIAQGISYAADQGARVANISLSGTSSSSTLQSAVDYAWNHNVVIVAAAGNAGNSTPEYPAACNHVLGISALRSDDTLPTWSSYGSWISLSAPGEGIWTTSLSLSNPYVSAAGTSFSSPIVAGVAALVASVNPSLSNSQIVSILEQTADDLGASGFDVYYGWGRVNAYNAVLAASGGTPAPADTTPPAASITAPANGATVSGNVSIAVNASDNVGVTKIELYLDGSLVATSNSASASFGWDTTTALDAVHTLQAKAYDAAGNSGTSSLLSVTVSNPLPSATITSPANSTTVSSAVNVTVSASDKSSIAKVELYIDGTLFSTSTSASPSFPWDTTTAVNGSHALLSKAYDQAGNAGSSAIVNVIVSNTVADTTAPTASITSPAAAATVSGTVGVAVSASDNVGVTTVELYLDGVLFSSSQSATPTFSWNTATVANGSHELLAKAYDAAGNVGSSTPVTVTVYNSAPDTTAPIVQITSPANGSSVSKSVKISVSASDNVGVTQVQLYIDGVLFGTDTSSPYTFTWSTAKVARGNHTLQAFAADAAGNVGSSATLTVVK